MNYEVGQTVPFFHAVPREGIVFAGDLAPWDNYYTELHIELLYCTGKFAMVLENQDLGEIVDSYTFTDTQGRAWGMQFPRPQSNLRDIVVPLKEAVVEINGMQIKQMSDLLGRLDALRKEYWDSVSRDSSSGQLSNINTALLARNQYDELFRRAGLEFGILIKRTSKDSHSFELQDKG